MLTDVCKWSVFNLCAIFPLKLLTQKLKEKLFTLYKSQNSQVRYLFLFRQIPIVNSPSAPSPPKNQNNTQPFSGREAQEIHRKIYIIEGEKCSCGKRRKCLIRLLVPCHISSLKCFLNGNQYSHIEWNH